jgi:hypothetical protein
MHAYAGDWEDKTTQEDQNDSSSSAPAHTIEKFAFFQLRKAWHVESSVDSQGRFVYDGDSDYWDRLAEEQRKAAEAAAAAASGMVGWGVDEEEAARQRQLEKEAEERRLRAEAEEAARLAAMRRALRGTGSPPLTPPGTPWTTYDSGYPGYTQAEDGSWGQFREPQFKMTPERINPRPATAPPSANTTGGYDSDGDGERDSDGDGDDDGAMAGGAGEHHGQYEGGLLAGGAGEWCANHATNQTTQATERISLYSRPIVFSVRDSSALLPFRSTRLTV